MVLHLVICGKSDEGWVDDPAVAAIVVGFIQAVHMWRLLKLWMGFILGGGGGEVSSKDMAGLGEYSCNC